jgi:IS1 family transposase
VVWERHPTRLQAGVDQGQRAQQYYSDQWAMYQLLVYYPGQHWVSEDKTDTYSVEDGNADLRHYLARLFRQSRSFSRCIRALWNAVKLFVYCYNSRQLYKHNYGYPAHLRQFVSPA